MVSSNSVTIYSAFQLLRSPPWLASSYADTEVRIALWIVGNVPWGKLIGGLGSEREKGRRLSKVVWQAKSTRAILHGTLKPALVTSQNGPVRLKGAVVLILLYLWFSTLDNSSSREHWQCLETCLIVTLWGILYWYLMHRGQRCYSASQCIRQHPTLNTNLAPNVDSAQVEKSYCTPVSHWFRPTIRMDA